MRLNHDCIRDILLYIEENTTDELDTLSSSDLISNLQSKYNEDTINYHLRKIHTAGLVDDILYSEGIPHCISSLSWEGHAYVDNIRDDKVWKKLKDISKSITSVSLPILIETAADVVKSFLF